MISNEQAHNNYRIPVPAEFEAVFSHFYFAANDTAEPLTKTLLPSYQMILVFSFGATVSLTSQQNTTLDIDKCLVLGPIKQAFDYTLATGSEILVANFTGNAFYRFFGTAVLANHLPVNPDQLLKENCFTNLWFELKELNEPSRRVEHILQFCRPYLREQDPTADLLIRFNEESQSPIKAIAKDREQSERSIQLNHKKNFGYSAKELTRYERFVKAVAVIQDIAIHSAKTDWFEVIEQCGYYDQSQLIHDFRHFINLTPGQFIKFQQEICSSNPE